MIHALLDTNVVIDALLERPPWSSDAKPLWQAHREKQFAAYVTATTLTDIFYLSHRHAGLAKAWQSVHYLLNHLPIISVGIDELRAAAILEGRDFEDNLQIACATRMQLDAIVTRDATGFTASEILVLTPPQMLRRLAGND